MIQEEELRKRIIEELSKVNQIHEGASKDAIRDIHAASVKNELEKSQKWILSKFPKYQSYFANGSELLPKSIKPVLIEVTEDWHNDLFRLARYTWSLPYTKGYGRRLRYLILDQSNNKLIGIFGLQSPPLDFPARDKLFDYPKDQKVNLVNQTMDVFTLGAVPPYNKLLAGKLVAYAVASNEVREAYSRKYSKSITELSKKVIPANLVCLTTTSAFGKSSIYNRLKYFDNLIGKPIGFTEGYGSFHLSTIYPLIKEYLEEKGVSTKGGFGVGPRIVWQSYIRAQELLDLPNDILKHGVKREVFLFPLIQNLENYMNGSENTPKFCNYPFADLVEWWKARWLSNRASLMDGWHEWSNEGIKSKIVLEGENA